MGYDDILKKMRDESNTRFDEWNVEKKNLHHYQKRPNRNDKGEIIFGIKSWSMWWFHAGENIGDEHGSHIDETTSRHSFKRPCVIISQPKQLKETGNNKVIILPFTSIKGQKERPYHVKILASNYPKILKLKGFGMTPIW